MNRRLTFLVCLTSFLGAAQNYLDSTFNINLEFPEVLEEQELAGTGKRISFENNTSIDIDTTVCCYGQLEYKTPYGYYFIGTWSHDSLISNVSIMDGIQQVKRIQDIEHYKEAIDQLNLQDEELIFRIIEKSDPKSVELELRAMRKTFKAIYPLEYGVFSDGLALVKNKKGIGFINLKGQLVIPTIFENATAFVNGRASVKYKGAWHTLVVRGEEATFLKPE